MQRFSAMDSQCVGRGTKIEQTQIKELITDRDKAIAGKAIITNCWKTWSCPSVWGVDISNVVCT